MNKNNAQIIAEGVASQHVYERDVLVGSGDSLDRIVSMLSVPGAVLDVGTGTGALARFLSERKEYSVDGITHNPTEAEIAQPYYRDVWVSDLSQSGWINNISGRRYRYIVCADVLEHLVDPAAVLRSLATLLDEHGEIIISVPNVAYIGVVGELINGKFTYRQEGLLDRTHLRFFTRESLADCVSSCKLQIREWSSVFRPLADSEFKAHRLDYFPPAMARFLAAQADSSVYQFVLRVGYPLDGEVAMSEPATCGVEPMFCAQVYWATAGTVHAEKDSVFALGRMGVQNQRLRFHLKGWRPNCTHLRIDPADRPGFLRLFFARLMDSAGRTLWAWRPEVSDFNVSGQITACPAGSLGDGVQLVLTGDDPHFMLTLPAGLTADQADDHVTFEMEVGWPLVPEAVVIGRELEATALRLVEREGAYRSLASERTLLVSRLTETLSLLERERQRTTSTEAALQELGAHVRELRQELASRDDRISRFEAQLSDLNRSRDILSDRLGYAESMLEAVKNSKLWRLGRILRLTRIGL
ncbi:bifunctional 2-polyprenyl-6-hydroxyphenol methylase/3-demethylubiquinol 3-O-methyltransferase UbiG [Chitinimonas sp. BJYL2]|uniref:class I SAM-dependent methyltransferase n=1 Tax=Chitinimonas sp. BJYL2 TaxID=2976696 RepID=UPI0022B4869F|nr:methyltransferase domain-containing protein [Chitinimonas sp. BJYL2]